MKEPGDNLSPGSFFVIPVDKSGTDTTVDN